MRGSTSARQRCTSALGRGVFVGEILPGPARTQPRGLPTRLSTRVAPTYDLGVDSAEENAYDGALVALRTTSVTLSHAPGCLPPGSRRLQKQKSVTRGRGEHHRSTDLLPLEKFPLLTTLSSRRGVDCCLAVSSATREACGTCSAVAVASTVDLTSTVANPS